MENLTTLTELKSFLQGRGIEVLEINGLIGFKPNRHVIHWFNGYFSETLQFIDFDHTYSMNTGKSKRGVTQRLAVKKMLANHFRIRLSIG